MDASPTRYDVELHGQLIPAGKLILPMIGSANRDPQQFRDADRFDVNRDPNPHLAFGHGIHSCLGRRSPAWKLGSPWGIFLIEFKGLSLPAMSHGSRARRYMCWPVATADPL